MDDSGVVNADALKLYVGRIEKLHNERDELNEDIRGIYAEAKEAGFDTTILREIVREHRMETSVRVSRYNLLDSYRHALGMLADTPLGQAAIERADKPKRGRPRKDPKPNFWVPPPEEAAGSA